MAVVRNASPDAFLAASGRMLARRAAYAAAVRRPGDLERCHLSSDDGDALGAAVQRGGGPAALAESDPPATGACSEARHGGAKALPAGVGAFAACGAFISARSPAAGFRTWKAGARVTHVAIGLAREPALCIAPIYALTVNRGRGDAGALVAGIAEGPLSARRRVVLATAVARGTSGLVYAPRGVRPFDGFYHFDLVAGP